MQTFGIFIGSVPNVVIIALVRQQLSDASYSKRYKGKEFCSEIVNYMK